MTARQPSPSAQLSALLSRFTPKTVTLVKGSLTKLRRTFPGSTQLVYDYSTSNYLVVSFGESERGYEAVVALGVSPRWVRLYFQDGKALPDPKGLLEGSASKVRHVTLERASDLDHRDIKELLKAAIKRSGVSFRRGGSIRIVIKSSAKKKRAKSAKRG